MTKRKLWLWESPEDPEIEDLVWRPARLGESSLHTNLDPSLAALGNVEPLNRDAVWLAAATFLADRTVKRSLDWQRDLELEVPVSSPTGWRPQKGAVEDLLSFLSSDRWSLEFYSVPDPPFEVEPTEDPKSGADLVCLFSGGADSLCGALRAIQQGRQIALVSHWDWSVHAGIQRELHDRLEDLAGFKIPHLMVQLQRRADQFGDDQRFPNEISRRSRSFMFIALGLATASVSPAAPLWIPENGFASLNPPLAPERLGSLSTRTTHPKFLAETRSVLERIGAHASFENPFSGKTKGEMFSDVATHLGNSKASRLLSASHSCSHTRTAGRFGRSPSTHCGTCFGCLVRRGAFISSGVTDRTPYLSEELTGGQLDEFLTPTLRRNFEAVRYAVTRGISPADVLALDLPIGTDLDLALNIIQRGFGELSTVRLAN